MKQATAVSKQGLVKKRRDGSAIIERGKLRRKQDFQKLTMMFLPLLKIFLFAYLPLAGILMAFENYSPSKLFFSRWVGFENFEFIFSSPLLFELLRNALVLNVLYIFFSTVIGVLLALFLYEITNKIFMKSVQTVFFFPYFIAWPAVGVLMISLLGTNGIITSAIGAMTGIFPDIYRNPSAWPWILTALQCWKYCGFSAVTNYAVLLGVERAMYEAADIDGAGRFQKMRYLSIPNLKFIVLINIITAFGSIIRVDFSMVYFSVGANYALYETVDVLETYMYRALISSSKYSQPVAMGVFQGCVGLVLSLAANWAIRRIDKDSALF